MGTECKSCKGTGRITLLTSVVECKDCPKPQEAEVGKLWRVKKGWWDLALDEELKAFYGTTPTTPGFKTPPQVDGWVIVPTRAKHPLQKGLFEYKCPDPVCTIGYGKGFSPVVMGPRNTWKGCACGAGAAIREVKP